MTTDLRIERAKEEMDAFYSQLSSAARRNALFAAKSYGRYFLPQARRDTIEHVATKSGLFNYAIASRDDDLSTLTKRATLVSDSLVLSSAPAPTGPQRGELFHIKAQHGSELSESHAMYHPAPRVLGQWLLDCERLMRGGLLAYYPFYSSGYHFRSGFGADDARWSHSVLDDGGYRRLVVRGRSVIGSPDGFEPRARLLVPVLQCDIPYLEGTGMRDYASITVDEFESFSAFRDFLRMRFIDMDSTADGAAFDAAQAKVAIEIRSGLRELNSNLRRIKRKRAVSAAGATIAASSATLVAVYGPALAEVISILGASGGLWGLMTAVQEYAEKHSEVENKPYYYLWLLGKSHQN